MKMKIIAYIFALIAISLAKPQVNPLLSDERIADINSKAKTWTAGRNFDPTTPLSSLKSLVGVLPQLERESLPVRIPNKVKAIPTSFDARDAWPKCNSIKMLRDQSNCGSCWAFGAVEAMSDRICIKSGQTKQTLVSAEHLNSCCKSCGSGCNGGYPLEAWKFWQSHGIVTGGLYGTQDGCQAYSMAPCEHHTSGSRPQCDDFNGGKTFPTPSCRSTCDSGVSVKYQDSLTYGQAPYTVRGVANIQSELMENGPLEVDFTVYDDFLNYKSGVYQVTKGASRLGGHAVKLIGWGTESGTAYWLVANSWNNDWGDHGFFKIRRGTNEASIESNVIGAIPK